MAALGHNKESIFQFRNFVSTMPHYRSNRVMHTRRYLAGTNNFARPAVHLDEKHVAVGTENPGAEQTLLCFNTDILKMSMEANPIVATTPLPKGVQGTHWVGPNTLLVNVGDKDGPSQFMIYNIDVGGSCVFELKDDTLRFATTIKEIAVNTHERNRIAFGGYDQNLSLMDLHHGPAPTSVFPLDGDLSSVRWEPFHNSRLVSCTTNEGRLKIFDVNGGPDPMWQHQTDIRAHLNLYSHCQISEFQIVLGYEDNYMEAVDIRKAGPMGCFMTGASDPFCYMVGDLHYREASGLLLATGMADFSVYKHYRSGADKNICKLWCHSAGSCNRESNDSGVVTHGVFLSDNWVVRAHGGSFSVYEIE